MVGSGEVFVCLLSAANGVGKTAVGANILAHLMYGQSGNKWFAEEEFEWEHTETDQSGTRKAAKMPLFQDFPFPKQGRIVSDPTTVAETIVPELHKWFPQGKYTTSKSGKNYEYSWKTNTGFQFELMTYEQRTKEFESATLGFAWFDEPPPAAIFKATVARMRLGGIIFITATPLTGSAWLYDHILTYKGEAKRSFIQSDIESNCIEHGIRGRLKHKDIQAMISEYSEDDKQARIHGRFHHLVGLVFKMFDRKIHVIRPFEIKPQDFVVVHALDPHPRVSDALMWVAVDRKGNRYVVDELYGKYKTGELASRVIKKNELYRIMLMLGDPAMWVEDKHKEAPELETLAAQLNNKYDLQYMKGTKDRSRADRRIRDAIDYQKSGDEMLIAPELFIFDHCTRTIWEFEHYQWDEWRGITADNKTPKEKPMDKDDHQIENLGRILLQEVPFSPMPADYYSSKGGSIVHAPKLDPFD